MWTTPSLNQLEQAIAEPCSPIGMRMRAAYFLRQAYDNSKKRETDFEQNTNQTIQERVITTLGKGLCDKNHGSLMRHEFAYVMGQLRDERCCDNLEKTLLDYEDCIMVRHECAEALGAIGAIRSMRVLQTAIQENKNTIEIYQTCEIAISHMQWSLKQQSDFENQNKEEPMACACMLSPYSSIDPAPPHPKHQNLSTSTLGDILKDSNQPLFERYRAMFSLRNRGGTDCVLQLCDTLTSDSSSALLRHEIAYVLGQMQHPASIDSLGQSLRRYLTVNTNGTDLQQREHRMVRHEAAEALGAIDDYERWKDVQSILMEFLHDEDIVVRESCIVALDAADYWGHSHSKETYTDTIANENETNLKTNEECESTSFTFVQQKAITNGKKSEKDSLLNHFNIKI